MESWKVNSFGENVCPGDASALYAHVHVYDYT